MGNQTKKKPFVIALPRELSRDVGNVENYNKVPKTGTIMATTPRGAVSEYLHRTGISSPNSNLIIYKLNQMGGRMGVGAYAFNCSEIETRDEKGKKIKTTPHDREIAQEAFISDFLSKRYGGKDTSYIGKARELLKYFENLR